MNSVMSLSVPASDYAPEKEAIESIPRKEGVIEIINVQPRPGGNAKPYQVKQVRELLVKYRIEIA